MDLNKLKKIDWKDPKIRNVAVIILLTAIGVYLWYSNVYEIRKNDIVNLEHKLKEKQAELQTILALKPQLNQLREEVKINEGKRDSLKSIFPDQKEIPKLLKEITSIARASGILTIKFDPLPDIKKEYYIENHYMLTVRGSYHSLANFYSFLANLPLIVNLTKVTIRPNSKLKEQIELFESYGNDIRTVTASFEMTTFSSKQ